MIMLLKMGMGEGFAMSRIKTGYLVKRVVVIAVMVMATFVADAADTNYIYSPCLDAKIQKGDGFTFGIAFSDRQSFLPGNGPQLSPCDKRLDLVNKGAQVSVFRPKVDKISLLTINRTNPGTNAYMVAFAGQKYAARSLPIMFADNSHTITSFTLVLEFQEGTLQNLYWKSFGCDACPSESICLDKQDCAVKNTQCQKNGGAVCNLGIQLTFSGTDKNLNVLNSWYEVGNLRQYSLYGLFSDLRNTIIGPYEKLF